MAFVPNEKEILSKSDINWIINGEAGDESVTNRPINDVANFVNTVKEYAIFTDPSKKNLTEQTISSPLKLNSYLGLHGGETGGIRFLNVGDENDSASISLTKDLEGNQFLKISSLNDAGDQIQFEVTDKDSIKVLHKNGTTVETSKIYHSGNHGKNSGLDADKIHGVSPDSLNTINAVVQRNSSGNFSANEITANKFLGNSTNVTGIVAAVNGGTGFSSFTYGDILFAKSATDLEKIPLGNAKEILISSGRASAPVWRRVKADDFLDGEIISSKNGGTGTSGLNGILFGNGENAVTIATGLQITSKIDAEYVKNAKYADSCGSLSALIAYTATSFNGITGLSSLNPLGNGVVSIGNSTTTARADHIHPNDTTKANISGSTFTGVISIIDGTQLTPGLNFKDDTDTGLFRKGSGNFSISCNNTEVINFANDKITAKKDIYALEINASKGNFSGTVSAPNATFTGNLAVGLNGILFGNGANAVTVATGLQITSKIDAEYVKNAKYADSCGGLKSTTAYTAASFNGITGLSSLNPLKNGVVSIGNSTAAARANHVHPNDTTKANISGSTFTGVISIIDGTQLTPGLNFKDDTDTGLFRKGSGNFSISCNNTEVINFANDKITAKKDIYALEINASKGNFSGTVSAPNATFTGNLSVNTSNVYGGGITLSDDGDIVDLNDGYCSMRFSHGVKITNGKQLTETKIYLKNDGQILASNDITSYFSDERLKEKTGIIENPIEKVKSLSAFFYKENDLAKSFGFKNPKTQIGLSAQAVQKVLPEAVNLAPFDMEIDKIGDCNSKSGNNYLTLDYAKLVPLLIEAIKEQQKQIEELQELQKLQNKAVKN